MQSHSKETKITQLFKRSRSENAANETHEIENIQDEQQTEQEAIVEKLTEDHSTVVTEASSSSALNPQLQVSAAVCTTQPTTTVSTKSDLTKIEQLSREFPDFYYCPIRKGSCCKVCVNFAGVTAPNILYASTAGFFADHKTRNSTIYLNSQRHQETLKTLKNKKSYNILASEIKVALTNKFVFKSFFRVAFCLIKHNWANMHNFEN